MIVIISQVIGMLFVVLSAIGFVFEYYRGVYAH